MYKTTIELKRDIPAEDYEIVVRDITTAFDNRVGRTVNSSQNPYLFVFEGGESSYACLDLGLVLLDESTLFWKWVQDWQWIDSDDPDECCSVIEVFSKPIW